MARKIGVAVVSLGQYLGKDGRRRANNREVGIVMQHSDGRMYIELRADFDFGRIPVPPGGDRFFMGLRLDRGVEVRVPTREPGQEG